VQLPRVALVFQFGPEVGQRTPCVVGLEVQMQADSVIDAADETHARVGLLFHDVFSG